MVEKESCGYKKKDFLIPTMFQNLWRYITGIDETITGENIILIDAFSGQKSLLRESSNFTLLDTLCTALKICF